MTKAPWTYNYFDLFLISPSSCRAEGDEVVWSAEAGKRTVLIIVSVTVSQRALLLEECGIGRGRTRLRCVVGVPTAVLILVERKAGALTPDNGAIGVFQLKLSQAVDVYVDRAWRFLAIAGSTLRDHRHRQVEPIDVADVVEVLSAILGDGDLDESRWWGPASAVALDLAGATVSGDAGELAGVGWAPASGPEPAAPRRRDFDCLAEPFSKLEPGGGELGFLVAG